jgi:hypothetical protein
MWSSENERLGFKRCTPLGYFLVSLAFLMFVIAAVALVAVCFLVVSRGLAARSSSGLLYFFLAPGGLGLAGWICIASLGSWRNLSSSSMTIRQISATGMMPNSMWNGSTFSGVTSASIVLARRSQRRWAA